MQAMGIDIGTTTVSMVLLDGGTGSLKRKRTIVHQASVQDGRPEHRQQDPEKLRAVVEEGVREMETTCGRPDCIGLTGQMHGMLYVDAQGNAVSPLYTWQDESGNVVMEDGSTCVQLLNKAAGNASAGYGLTTHFYLQRQGRIPKAAVKMSTISDYIGMRLCKSTEPVISRDMAASWGCFHLERGDFFRKELTALGIDISYLPRVSDYYGIMGTTMEGIPVMVSLGDNQASVIGSVQDLRNTVLLNIGTGGQVSFGTDRYLHCTGAVELRPCLKGIYLMTGSSLCGGRAYGMLEQFYREIAGDGKGDLYGAMEEQARGFLKKYGKDSAWKICTAFSGTRNNPEERGRIESIGIDNFHPGAMTLGMMQGILTELHDMYLEMCKMSGTKAERFVGSGNGIRKNALMRELAEEIFEMKMELPAYEEEAACGAALHALEVYLEAEAE